MVININPNRINVTTGTPGRTREHPNAPAALTHNPVKPARAHVNYIPDAESLRTLIAGAVAALRGGVRWDRGSILNLLV